MNIKQTRQLQRGLLLFALCITARLIAQVSTAVIIGTVEDTTRASIPDASVKLINTETGSENDSATDSEGRFILPGILPGIYTMQIGHNGFATAQINKISLNVGDIRNLLIRMRVGSVTESVIVDASGLTLNRNDASVSAVIDRKFVSSIPLNGRSFQDLISLTPGIVTQSPQAATLRSGTGTQDDFSVNGQSPEANAFFVDGVSANIDLGLLAGETRLASTGSIQGSTALGTTQSLVSVDALQEFRVLSSTYSAEYGRTPGGQFTFLTRSGTNTVHGSLYNYSRDSDFDAYDWFTGINPITHVRTEATQAPYNQNDFGGTLGAPIILPHLYNGRDRSFVFFSYEGLYLNQPTPQSYQYSPAVCNPNTAGEVSSITTCNEAPYDVPSAMVPVLATFPLPNSPEIDDAAGNPTGLAENIVYPSSFPAHVNATSVRLDHALGPKHSIFFRFGDSPSYGQTNQLWSVTANQSDTQTFTFGATDRLSAKHDNEFRLGYVRTDTNTNTITETTNGGYDKNLALSLNTALGIPDSYASASGDAYVHIVGVGDSDSNTNQVTSSLHQWNLRDNFHLDVGKHLLNLGIDERHIVSSITPPELSVQADFFDRNSIANNSASDIVLTKSSPARPILNEFSAFAEDQWKVSNTLTLSLGIRWEVDPPPKGTNGQDAFTAKGDIDSPQTLSLAPRGTRLWQTGWSNFAPRMGADWLADTESGKELVLRFGAGIFFDTGTQSALGAFNGVGFSASSHLSNAPVPVTPPELDFSTTVAPPYTNTTVFAFPSHLQLPYSLEWNLGVEKALDKNQTLTISYVGASGHRLLRQQRRNLNGLNPSFGDLVYFPTGLTSNYQSLQARFQRSLSHGLEALASYTWAHSFDYGSTDPAFPLVYGNSNLDVRDNVEAAVSWDLPSSGNRGLNFKRLTEGWGADARLIARTGFPVNLFGNFFFDPVTSDPYYSGLDLIPGRPLYLRGPQYPGHRIFNGGPDVTNPAFVLPGSVEAGDAPRNLLRGFGAVQANLALRKDIHIYERMNLQFKAEAFNVFNHPNFGYIDPHLSDLLFGQATKMLDQSFGASGALYEQGGPRSLQLSLKLVF